MGGSYCTRRKCENACKIVGKSEGERPQGRTKKRWEHLIKIVVMEIDCEYLIWKEFSDDDGAHC
jgi:hypothetical protein